MTVPPEVQAIFDAILRRKALIDAADAADRREGESLKGLTRAELRKRFRDHQKPDGE